MQDWFYAQNGQQHGPISEQELQDMADSGDLRPDDLIWKDGMPEWVPAGHTDGLFPGQRRATQYDAPPDAYAYEPRQRGRAAYADDWDEEPRRRGRAAAPSSNKGALFGVFGGVVALLLIGGAVVYLLNNSSNSRSFTLRIGRTDKHSVKFEKGKVVEITAKAKKGKHLDVFVYDNRGRKIVGAESPTNECRVVFIPESTQTYSIRVVNPRIQNRPEFNETMSGEVSWKIHDAKKMAKRDHGNPPEIVCERSFSLDTNEASTHYIRFETGKTVEVTVRSNGESDVDLFIFDETGRRLARDESLSSHCRLVIAPDRTQIYKLQVVNRNLIDMPQRNGHNSGMLKWTFLGPGQQLAKGKIIQPMQPLAIPNAQGGVQQPPFTVRGLLTPNSPKLPGSNRYYSLYTVEFKQGSAYTIEMTAGFDTYLYLHDDTGKQLGSDDDGGVGLNSRMVFRPLQTGVYRIYASSYSNRHHGPFTLTVR